MGRLAIEWAGWGWRGFPAHSRLGYNAHTFISVEDRPRQEAVEAEAGGRPFLLYILYTQ